MMEPITLLIFVHEKKNERVTKYVEGRGGERRREDVASDKRGMERLRRWEVPQAVDR